MVKIGRVKFSKNIMEKMNLTGKSNLFFGLMFFIVSNNWRSEPIKEQLQLPLF